MGYSVTAHVPRPRLLHHRGSFNPVRIQSLHGRAAHHIRLALQPGLSLFEALVRPLAEAGITAGGMAAGAVTVTPRGAWCFPNRPGWRRRGP